MTFEIHMVISRRNILILIILLITLIIPNALAEPEQQLSLSLVGQGTNEYVAPAGERSVLKMEILNTGMSDVYLVQGEAFLDPDLSGAWQLVHSEVLGSFHLNFLQSAIWTFDLTVPAEIHAVNATNGTPQVNLLVKIIYRIVGQPEREEQSIFALGVPGAIVHQSYNLIWYALSGAVILISFVAVYIFTRRRRMP